MSYIDETTNQKFCGNCGRALNGNLRFCTNCGYAIENFQNQEQKAVDYDGLMSEEAEYEFTDGQRKKGNPLSLFSVKHESFSMGLLSTHVPGIRKVKIPAKYNNIGRGAFKGCSSLEEVLLPDTITMIWPGAFSECTSLKEINFPDSVKSIGDWAFRGCTSLKKIVFPSYLELITTDAFDGCSSLEEIVIPSTVKIKHLSLLGCKSLKRIYILNPNVYVGYFKDCSMSITIYGYKKSAAEKSVKKFNKSRKGNGLLRLIGHRIFKLSFERI